MGKFRFHSVEIQDFCIAQILREINFEDSRSAKTAIFAILRTVNSVHLVKNAKLAKIPNSEPFNVVKWLILHFQNPQIDFT